MVHQAVQLAACMVHSHDARVIDDAHAARDVGATPSTWCVVTRLFGAREPPVVALGVDIDGELIEQAAAAYSTTPATTTTTTTTTTAPLPTASHDLERIVIQGAVARRLTDERMAWVLASFAGPRLKSLVVRDAPSLFTGQGLGFRSGVIYFSPHSGALLTLIKLVRFEASHPPKSRGDKPRVCLSVKHLF